jgi:hypothetical protein
MSGKGLLIDIEGERRMGYADSFLSLFHFADGRLFSNALCLALR